MNFHSAYLFCCGCHRLPTMRGSPVVTVTVRPTCNKTHKSIMLMVWPSSASSSFVCSTTEFHNPKTGSKNLLKKWLKCSFDWLLSYGCAKLCTLRCALLHFVTDCIIRLTHVWNGIYWRRISFLIDFVLHIYVTVCHFWIRDASPRCFPCITGQWATTKLTLWVDFVIRSGQMYKHPLPSTDYMSSERFRFQFFFATIEQWTKNWENK